MFGGLSHVLYPYVGVTVNFFLLAICTGAQQSTCMCVLCRISTKAGVLFLVDFLTSCFVPLLSFFFSSCCERVLGLQPEVCKKRISKFFIFLWMLNIGWCRLARDHLIPYAVIWPCTGSSSPAEDYPVLYGIIYSWTGSSHLAVMADPAPVFCHDPVLYQIFFAFFPYNLIFILSLDHL